MIVERLSKDGDEVRVGVMKCNGRMEWRRVSKRERESVE